LLHRISRPDVPVATLPFPPKDRYGTPVVAKEFRDTTLTTSPSRAVTPAECQSRYELATAAHKTLKYAEHILTTLARFEASSKQEDTIYSLTGFKNETGTTLLHLSINGIRESVTIVLDGNIPQLELSYVTFNSMPRSQIMRTFAQALRHLEPALALLAKMTPSSSPTS
jgi:hypothetical protein